MSVHTDCKETEAIRELFDSGRVNGNSDITELKFIGPYIKQRALSIPNGFLALGNNLKIEKVKDLISMASRARTQARVDKLLEYCTYNRRRNTCVPQGNQPKYQVPDVNVCGYNSLLAVLKYAHQHRNVNHFPQTYDLRLAVNLSPRERGHSGGSRYCTCIQNRNTCIAHSDDCIWDESESTCHSKVVGRQPGFKGTRLGNNRHAGQYIRGAEGVRHGHQYKKSWRQTRANANADPPAAQDEEPPQMPDEDDAQDDDQPAINNNPPVANRAPEPPPPRQPRRSTRQRRPSQRFDSVIYELNGGQDLKLTPQELVWLDRCIHRMEMRGGKKMSDSRRFRNFVRLTSLN